MKKQTVVDKLSKALNESKALTEAVKEIGKIHYGKEITNDHPIWIEIEEAIIEKIENA